MKNLNTLHGKTIALCTIQLLRDAKPSLHPPWKLLIPSESFSESFPFYRTCSWHHPLRLPLSLLVLLFHCIVHLSGKHCHSNLLCVLHNIKQRASHIIALISISAHWVIWVLYYFITVLMIRKSIYCTSEMHMVPGKCALVERGLD